MKGLFKGVKLNIPKLIDRLPDIPNRALDVLDQLYEGRIEMENKSKELNNLRKEMKIYSRSTVLAVVGSGFLLSSAIIYALDNTTHGVLASVPVVSWLLGYAGMMLLYLSWQQK